MPTIDEYLAEHDRLPRIGDDIPPYHYRGWLMPYVRMICQSHPDVPDRHSYLDRVLADGVFPDDPIPRIEFEHPNRDVMKGIDAILYGMTRYSPWESFRRLVEVMAYGLGVAMDMPEISDEEHEHIYRTLDIGPWLLHPSDYLGAYICQQRGNSKWNPNAFYPTPHNVCEAMVGMQMSDGSGIDKRAMSVCDPCMGTGRMLMHASNHSMSLYGQDIDPFAVLCTKVNGALYMPWLIYPPKEAIDRERSLIRYRCGHTVTVPDPYDSRIAEIRKKAARALCRSCHGRHKAER